MKFIYVSILLLFSVLSHAQTNRYLKISGGKIFFGTGDVPGYGIYTEYSFQLGKQKQTYWKHFQIGGELGFEAGAIQPLSTGALSANTFKFFDHISNSSLFAKLAYYPIGTSFLKRIYVGLGPTAGYTFVSREGTVLISQLPDGTFTRTSNLQYDNNAFVGYRISVGYEYYFRKILIGARIDWSNNLDGDMNSMYGAKIGWKL